MDVITILIPAYNEEAVIQKLFRRLEKLQSSVKKYKFEFLFVNDGSHDETMHLIREQGMKNKAISYINLSRNFGKEIAMIAGLDHARGDAVVIIDADLQDPPELIPEMITYWKHGYDDVYAKREDRRGETFVKKITSTLFYRLLDKTTHIMIQKDTGDFRLLSRRCVEAIKSMRESQRYTKGLFSWVGYKKKEISYVRDPRAAGQTKWNYLKLINLAIEGIVTFTTAPLRISTLLGILISAIAFIYTIVVTVRTLLYGSDVGGYPSLIVIILFIGGVQLLSLGIIGEYIGRIFTETKQRPLYFIEEYHDGTEEI